jgi:hypothetical protein
MKLELFERAALTHDVPKHHLKKGDVVRVIDYLDNPEPGYALEVFDALGNTVDVLSVPEYYLEALREGELLQVRHVEADAL